jgi:CheY-like chemotaxis protein
VAGRDFCVLHVEDNPLSRTLVAHLLETVPGAHLLDAASADAGFALARRHRPDIIILDLHLPDDTGLALLRRLRTLPELAQTPVVALSASAMPREIKAGLEAGFFRYLTKPLDVNLFVETLSQALGHTPGEGAGREPDGEHSDEDGEAAIALTGTGGRR